MVEPALGMWQRRTLCSTKEARCFTFLEHETWCLSRPFQFARWRDSTTKDSFFFLSVRIILMSLNFYIVCFDFQVDVQWWKETNGHPRNGSTSMSSRFKKTKIRGGNLLKSWTIYYWHVQNFIQSFIFNFFYLFVGLHDSTSLCGYSYEQMYCCISLLKWEMIRSLGNWRLCFMISWAIFELFLLNYLRFFL